MQLNVELLLDEKRSHYLSYLDMVLLAWNPQCFHQSFLKLFPLIYTNLEFSTVSSKTAFIIENVKCKR
ncbi:hypothetical protein V1477_010187 [Vespula maculifrons]|uniref:Maturase K n=1 Tax=Vespula maculifrons TaxID=7453 RepID=A0ABD2C7V6_VESMC